MAVLEIMQATLIVRSGGQKCGFLLLSLLIMKNLFKLSKLFLALALLPAWACAVSITITGEGSSDGTWDVTTATGTFIALQSQLETQEWWGNSSLAGIFVGQVGSSLGSPNNVYGNNYGPFFAYAFDGGVDLAYFYNGKVVDAPSSWNPIHSWTWATATRVPDTGSTAALLGVGVAALAFARCRLG